MSDQLSLMPEAVGRMTRPERVERVRQLTAEAHDILARSITEHVLADDRSLAATCILFSGGNDSTVLAHLMRETAHISVHANTGIGIEQTRQFVRDTCRDWGLHLIERSAPNAEKDSYRALVLDRGFPGPAMHWKMYQRLKERALEQVRRELVRNPYRERIVFLAGRRRNESERRADVPESERRGSTVWVSPLVNWTKLDLTTYRLMHGDVPVNEVSDLIHMSGECLCGSFAKPGEREELTYWFPADMDLITELEAAIADRDDIPTHRKSWGWGADPANHGRSDARASRVGIACSSCQPIPGQIDIDGGTAA